VGDEPAPKGRKKRCFTILLNAISVLASTVDEIFDESAYNRFLKRQGITSSAAAYAAFLQESGDLKARRPRCC
jgi:hypothetical protein